MDVLRAISAEFGPQVIRHDEEGEVMETVMPRFNIGFPNGGPTRDEIAEWHAKTDHLELA